MKMRPVTEDDLIKVKRYQATGYSRNQIARLIDRAGATVSLLLKSSTLENYQILCKKASMRKAKRLQMFPRYIVGSKEVVEKYKELSQPNKQFVWPTTQRMLNDMDDADATVRLSYPRHVAKRYSAKSYIANRSSDKLKPQGDKIKKIIIDEMDDSFDQTLEERVFNWPHTSFKWPVITSTEQLNDIREKVGLPVYEDDNVRVLHRGKRNEKKLDPPELKPDKASLHGKLDLILRYLRVIHTAMNLEPFE